MLTQIIWLLSWPLLIFLSYYAINWTFKKYFQEEKGSSRKEP